jgi:hypothetical protein
VIIDNLRKTINWILCGYGEELTIGQTYPAPASDQQKYEGRYKEWGLASNQLDAFCDAYLRKRFDLLDDVDTVRAQVHKPSSGKSMKAQTAEEVIWFKPLDSTGQWKPDVDEDIYVGLI